MEGGVWRVVYGGWCIEGGVLIEGGVHHKWRICVPYALPAQAVSPSVTD